MPFAEGEAHVGPGDVLVIHTDGVTDARDLSGAFFGEDRLAELLATATGRAPSAVATAIVEAVRDFRGGAEPYDDLTLLLAGRDAD